MISNFIICSPSKIIFMIENRNMSNFDINNIYPHTTKIAVCTINYKDYELITYEKLVDYDTNIKHINLGQFFSFNDFINCKYKDVNQNIKRAILRDIYYKNEYMGVYRSIYREWNFVSRNQIIITNWGKLKTLGVV